MLIRLSTVLIVLLAGLGGRGALRAADGRELRVVAQVEGSASKSSISATAANELGQPAAGAVVSFQLPAQAPSGQFANGLRTEIVVAGADGRATVSGVHWDEGAAPVAIRVTAAKGGLRAATIVEWHAAPAQFAPIPASKATTPLPAAGVQSAAGSVQSPAPDDTAIPVYRGGGSGWGKRMLIIAAIAGGVAAAGLVARSRQTSGAVGAVTTTPGTTTTPGFSIGAPIITIGKP